MKKIAINQLTTMRWSFDEDVVHLSKRGVDLLGVCRHKADDFGIERCQEILSEHSISVSSFGCLTFYADLTGPKLEQQIRQGMLDVVLAARLNAGCLILHTGCVSGQLPKNRFCMAEKILSQLLPVAEEHGVRLAIEPLACNEVSGARHSLGLIDSMELIERYPSEHLGLVLDLFHVGNRFLEMSPEWLEKNVALIQLSDFAVRNNRRHRMPIGHGDLDLMAFCDLVDRSGYSGVFEFELYGEAFETTRYEWTLDRIMGYLAGEDQVPASDSVSLKA